MTVPNLTAAAEAPTPWSDVVLVGIIAAFVLGVLWIFFRGDR